MSNFLAMLRELAEQMLAEQMLADARADVEARVKAGARRLNPDDPADAAQIERNRQALAAALEMTLKNTPGKGRSS